MMRELKSFVLSFLLVFVMLLIVNAIATVVDIIIEKNRPPIDHVYVCIDGYAFEKIEIDGGNYAYDPVLSENVPKKCIEMAEESIRDGFARIK